MTPPSPLRSAWLAVAALACACTGPEPAVGTLEVSAAAPVATLSGTTRGTRPAIELSPGCPGYLDPERPGYRLAIPDDGKVALTARSSRGPLALVVARDDEVLCDSDDGTGHAPEVVVERAGTYALYVASLREPAELPYRVEVRRAGAEEGPDEADARELAVTVTSDPSGATVLDPAGEVLGTTPAMFALPEPEGDPPTLVLALEGHEAGSVSLERIGDALVGHGTLERIVPPGLEVTSEGSARIRDYRVARQSLEVEQDCTIETAEVDVDIQHSYIGDLRVILRSPAGSSITLHRWNGGSRHDLRRTYTMEDRSGALARVVGEDARGTWRMSVHDDADADLGTFRSFTVRLTCSAEIASAAATTRATPRPRRPPAPRMVRSPPRRRPIQRDVLDPWH